ncbi:MAG TPA: hypothetical protein VF320_09775 [Acidimicrobiales bacterium]
MTVRLTPTESDSTPPPHDPFPSEPTDRAAAAPAGDTAPNSSDDSPDDSTAEAPGDTSIEARSSTEPAEPATGPSGAVDSRVALRDARRRRRRVAWWCAALVAISLALTIVVVSLARNRPAPTPGSVVSSALVVPSTEATGSTALPHDPFPGAPAPEGGNP